MKLAVLSPENGWHFRDLARAAAGRSGLEVIPLEFGRLAAAVAASAWPGSMADANPDRVLVRTMPAGSLEQIVFRMDALQRAAAAGTRIVNSPKAIEASVDKYLSLALLETAGIRVPETRVSQSVDQAIEDFRRLGEDVVLKPIFGSLGRGLERISDRASAEARFFQLVNDQRVIYQQRFIDHGGSDIRLFVIGHRVWAMKRVNTQHWITNIYCGGIGEPYSASETECELALAASDAVGAEIAGIDVLYPADGGAPSVLEVNASPGWQAISRVLDVDIASEILSYLESSDGGSDGKVRG